MQICSEKNITVTDGPAHFTTVSLTSQEVENRYIYWVMTHLDVGINVQFSFKVSTHNSRYAVIRFSPGQRQ